MSSNLGQTMAESIYDGSKTVIQQEISKAGFDKTISAEIVDVIDATIGKYKLKYQDATFVAYSENMSATYRKGVMVNVLLPKGDMSAEYKQILGATARLGINYVDEPDSAAIYVKNGSNCFNNTGSFTLPISGEEYVIYSIESKEDSLISLINEEELNNYLKTSKNMLFNCNIRTNIPTHLRRKGKYGVRIELYTESDVVKAESMEKTVKTFIFDTDDVIGLPYYLPAAYPQEKVFTLDEGEFQSIKSITLFTTGFDTDKKEDGTVTFSNLGLFGATILSETEVASYSVNIETPQGKYLSANKTSIPLEAKVYIKGKLANRDEQKYKVYWFVQNARVTTTHERYLKVGGQGWACINEYERGESSNLNQNNEIEVTDTSKKGLEFLDGESTYNAELKDCPAKNTVFKCVIEYEKQSFESTVEVINSNAEYDLSISCDQDVHFSNDIGTTFLTLKVNGQQPTENYEYVWNKVSLDGSVVSANPKKEDNSQDLTVNPLEIQIKDISVSSIYNCSVYSTAEGQPYLGTASITLYNENKAKEYTLVIVNGKQAFKYDVRGYSPTHQANEHQTAIQELSFEIYDKKGQKIKDEVIAEKVKGIEWTSTFVDSGSNFDSMLKPISSTKTPLGDKWIIRDNKIINFQIKDNYSYSAGHNQIELNLNFYKNPNENPYHLSAITEFVFTKEGAQGTNGTENGVCWISTDKPFFEINNIDEINISLIGNPSGGTFSFLSRSTEEVKQWVKIEGDKLIKNWANTKEENLENINKLNHILQYKAVIDNYNCTNVIPIVSTYYLNKESKYRFALKPYTGFLNVQYETNGRYPKYDLNSPFEIVCKEIQIDENGASKEVVVENTLFTYTWENSDLLSISNDNTAIINGKGKFVPVEHYDGYSYKEYIIVTISKDNTAIAKIHIPIYFYINKYSNADINEWSGNGIEIKEESGIILSPQVGAGEKHEDNTFTGVIIGTKETYTDEKRETETGLFGYNHGQQTIFLDAKSGKAEFGVEGKGQIIINPGHIDDANNVSNAQIYGGNYVNKNDDKQGIGSGLLIDLTEPEIRFGTENFYVLSNGYIHAGGGGDIAGWEINDYQLHKDNTGMSSVTDTEVEGVTNGKYAKLGVKSTAFWAGANEGKKDIIERPFMVAHDGTAKISTAIIGKGKYNSNNDDSIYIGGGTEKTDGSQYSAIYSGKQSFENYDEKGFYLGADGLAIGQRLVGGEAKKDAHAFSVDADGNVKMTTGQIGYDDTKGGTKYWTIKNNTITHNNKRGYSTNDSGVYIGTDGIGLRGTDEKDITNSFWVDANGNMNGSSVTITGGRITIGKILENNEFIDTFTVDEDGNVTAYNINAVKGKIGSWNINSTYLQGGNTKLDSSGSLLHTGGKWTIDSAGNATFNNITANGGTIAGITISKDDDGNPTGLSAGDTADSTKTGFKINKNGGITASQATIGGQINATGFDFKNGNFYMNMGTATRNPNVSGINIGSEGIRVGCSQYGSDDGSSGESIETLKIATGVRKIDGGIEYSYRNLTFKSGIFTGVSETSWETVAI